MRAATGTMMRVSCDHQSIARAVIRRCAVRDTISDMNSSSCITRRVNTSSISGTFSDRRGHGTDSSLPLHETIIAQYYDNDDDETKGKRTSVRQLTSPSAANLQHGHLVKNNPSSSLSSFSHPHNKSRISAAQSYQICQSRAFGLSSRAERAPQAAVLALGSIALTAKAGQYAVQAYSEWKKDQPEPPPPSPEDKSTSTGADDAKSNESNEGKTKKKDTNTGNRENFFQKYFNIGVGSKYYEGGFEDKMTKREAALMLGVRESSTPKRIKEAHRKLLILNHPDTGGSTYLSGKLSEAKDMLLKGNRGKK